MLGLILYDFSFFSSIFGHYMALALPADGSRQFFGVGLYTTIFFVWPKIKIEILDELGRVLGSVKFLATR